MEKKEKPEVVVVGGGISGLTSALALLDAGFDVNLYEQKERLGGLIHTTKNNYGLAESAANGIIHSSSLENLFQRLRVPLVSVLPAGKSRYLYVDQKVTRWPLSVWETIRLLRKLIFYRLSGWQKLAPQANQTVSDWATKHFGEFLDKKILGPALLGVYASSSNEMSASLLLNHFFEEKNKNSNTEKRSKVGTVAPMGGMGALVDALEKAVREAGAKIYLKQSYQWQKWREGQVPHVLATSVRQASLLTKDLFPSFSESLFSIRMLPVVSATLFFSSDDYFLKGFGCLFAQEEKMNSLGVLFPSFIFPHRTQNFHAETWILGGAVRPDIVQYSEEEILKMILQDREKLSGRKTEVLDKKIFIWPEALPYYDLHLESVLSRLKIPRGLFLTGNYLGKIGLAHLIERSLSLPKEIFVQQGAY